MAICTSALHMLSCNLEYLSIFKPGQLLLTLQSPAPAFLKCSRQNWPSPPWNSLSPAPIRLDREPLESGTMTIHLGKPSPGQAHSV